jgi:hypothetical protein
MVLHNSSKTNTGGQIFSKEQKRYCSTHFEEYYVPEKKLYFGQ